MGIDPLDVQTVREAMTGRLIGSEIVHHEVLGSTMDEAARIAEKGCNEGVVVFAEAQTQARGRFGRSWISPARQNVYCSVVLKPPTKLLNYINMAACIAVVDSIRSLSGLSASIKWPNDVRINNRKLAGVLVESTLRGQNTRYAIVGIGLNVNLDPAQNPTIASIATSLFRETGRQWDRTRVTKYLLGSLDDLYSQVKQGLALTAQWAALLETLGLDVTIQCAGRIDQGRAYDVDDQGNLMIIRNDGSTFTAIAGEVTLQDRSGYVKV